MRLHGYTSCSLTRNTAESFMWENKESGHQKVLFHIKWKNLWGAYFLNTGAYEHEEEVLLADGAQLIVDSVEDYKDEEGKFKYILITARSYNAK